MRSRTHGLIYWHFFLFCLVTKLIIIEKKYMILMMCRLVYCFRKGIKKMSALPIYMNCLMETIRVIESLH